MINPRKAHQMYAPPSEFEMFLEVWAAGNFNSLINTVDRVISKRVYPVPTPEKPRYSRTSELDADEWDAEHRAASEPGNEHGAHSLPEEEDEAEQERRTR